MSKWGRDGERKHENDHVRKTFKALQIKQIGNLRKVIKSEHFLSLQDFSKTLIIPCPNGGLHGDGKRENNHFAQNLIKHVENNESRASRK